MSPPPAPSLSSPHAEVVEQQEQRPAGDGRIAMEVVAEKCMVGGDAQEQQHTSESPPPPPSTREQQQQQLPAKAPPTPWPPPTLQELPACLGALTARSGPSATWLVEANGHWDWILGQRLRGVWEGAGWSEADQAEERDAACEIQDHSSTTARMITLNRTCFV